MIEQLKHLAFNFDMRAGERLFFFTTTGWMMWNFLVSSLLSNVTPVLYDGNPAWPDGDLLWKMVQDSKANLFGASPTYQSILEKNGIVPKDKFDLSSLKSITLAGSPVSPECQAWFHENVKQDCWIGARLRRHRHLLRFRRRRGDAAAAYAGEMQARCLGIAVHVIGENGQFVIDEVGEMVVTQPMPSMPVGFWNDKNDERFTETYFSDFPGMWRQGDFYRVNARGGAYVLGRSDATLNRHGIRIGTSEIYRTIVLVPGVEDGLIVNLDLPGGKFFMPLFVKLAGWRECWTTRWPRPSTTGCAANTRRATSPTRSTRCLPFPTRSPASAWKCRCAASWRACRWPRPPTATPWRIRLRSTSSSSTLARQNDYKM